MKKTSHSLLAALILLLSFSAKAELTENVTIVKRSNVLENSSEHLRMTNTYLLTAQLIGFAVAPIPASGLNAGLYIDRNSIVQLEYSKGTLPYVFFDLHATTFGANYKHFYGNSFYTKVGIDYRNISVSTNDFFLTKEQENVGTAETVVGNLAIGNQWQWNNFTMGCDWIGINPQIAVLRAHYDTTGMNEEDRNDIDYSWNKLAKVTSWQLLRFYLGASF